MIPAFTERFGRELYDLKATLDFYFKETDAFEHELNEVDHAGIAGLKIEKAQFLSNFRMLRQRLLKTKSHVRRQERMLENIILERNLESLRPYLVSSQNALRSTMYDIGVAFLQLKYEFQKFYMGLLSESRYGDAQFY